MLKLSQIEKNKRTIAGREDGTKKFDVFQLLNPVSRNRLETCSSGGSVH